MSSPIDLYMDGCRAMSSARKLLIGKEREANLRTICLLQPGRYTDLQEFRTMLSSIFAKNVGDSNLQTCLALPAPSSCTAIPNHSLMSSNQVIFCHLLSRLPSIFLSTIRSKYGYHFIEHLQCAIFSFFLRLIMLIMPPLSQEIFKLSILSCQVCWSKIMADYAERNQRIPDIGDLKRNIKPITFD